MQKPPLVYVVLLSLMSGPAAATGPATLPSPLIKPSGVPSLVTLTGHPPTENDLLRMAMEFLIQEGLDPETVQVELREFPVSPGVRGGTWRPLAEVFVDEKPDGTVVRKMALNRSYWLGTEETSRADHRWTKVLWHEIHHLNYFLDNLRQAKLLRERFPPAGSEPNRAWERRWVDLLEPLEELAAERHCIDRYQAAFGSLPDNLLSDSRSDMLKHAARYQNLLTAILADVQDPRAVLQHFPSELPIDSEGNIL